MEHKFSIQDFEGPLDLLLYLVQKKEIDIMDIDVKVLSDQYVNFIRGQKNLKLEIASEYLVMASYLIELKSKAIIPIEMFSVDGEYDQTEKQKLIEKLIEYKKYKKTVKFFKDSLEKRLKIFTKEPEPLKELEIPIEQRGVGLLDAKILSNAMKKMFERILKEKPLKTFLSAKPINMEKLELEILSLVHKKSTIELIDLFEDRWDRAYIVATVICILDLTKNKLVKITQKNEFCSIHLEKG